jgi:flagella basal body P-ring formation protein FlgA
MIWCSSLLAAGLAFAPAHADSVPRANLVAAVRREIAARWSVDTAALQLEWGLLPPMPADSALPPFHLSGAGTDGWFVVIMTPAHGGARAARVRAGVVRSVPSAARDLHIGDHITADAVVLKQQVVWGIASVALPASLAGWEMRRDLHQGEAFAPMLITAPRLVSVGDHVVLTWDQRGVHIERDAVALTSARLGELVQARAGTVRLTARVTAPDTALAEGGQ